MVGASGKKVKNRYGEEFAPLSQQNKKLKATRDLLLPKLVARKIDVEEITV